MILQNLLNQDAFISRRKFRLNTMICGRNKEAAGISVDPNDGILLLLYFSFGRQRPLHFRICQMDYQYTLGLK